MSVKGIWTADILGILGWESMGILVLEKKRAISGGNHHYAVGSYEVSGKKIRISLSAEYFGKPRTLFGAANKKLDVKFKGKIEDGVIEGIATPGDSSNHEIRFRLTRRSGIPACKG